MFASVFCKGISLGLSRRKRHSSQVTMVGLAGLHVPDPPQTRGEDSAFVDPPVTLLGISDKWK